jgi:hypothetical protein
MKASPYSAQYMPHSDNVVFYRNGSDLGFMRWADRSLWVTTGTVVSTELEIVAAAYLAAHSSPEDDGAIVVQLANVVGEARR